MENKNLKMLTELYQNLCGLVENESVNHSVKMNEISSLFQKYVDIVSAMHRVPSRYNLSLNDNTFLTSPNSILHPTIPKTQPNKYFSKKHSSAIFEGKLQAKNDNILQSS
jgi:hypothetical protein